MFYTYILYSKSTKSFYKGSTSNLIERHKRHNNAYEKATKAGVPWILVWSTTKPSRSEAQVLEFKLKNLSIKRTCEFILKYNDGVGGTDNCSLESNYQFADFYVSIRIRHSPLKASQKCGAFFFYLILSWNLFK